MLDRYLDWLEARYRLVVALAILFCLILAAGAHRLTVTNDMRAYFSEDNPELQAYEHLEATYTRQDNLLFFVVADEGDLFSEPGLALIAELTEAGWQAPYVQRVDSLVNYQHTEADGDDLRVADLVGEAFEFSPAALARVREIALNEPTLINRLISPGGVASNVALTLVLPEDDLGANDVIVEWGRERLAELSPRFPGFTIYLLGSAPTNVALGEAVEGDLRTLVGTSYTLIFFLLALLLRRVDGMAATLALVTLAVAATMGSFGWASFTLEAVAGFVPSIVMTISVADSVHLLSTYYYELRRGREREVAVREAMRVNFRPILLTSVTTTVGLLTLNFSDSPPYRDLGNMIALGVMLAFFLSVTFLPALLLWMPSRKVERGRRLEALTSRLAEQVIRHRRLLLAAGSLVIVVVASAIPSNELTERWHEYFDDSFEIRRGIDTSESYLGGLHLLRYSVKSAAGNINDPGYLADLDRLTGWLRAHPSISQVTSVSDIFKRLNRNLHGDDPVYYRVPESRELAAQYLLLYEFSLPLGLGLEDSIAFDKTASQLIAIAKRTDSKQLIRLDREILERVEAAYPNLEVGVSGSIDMMFSHINDRNIQSLLIGMVVALVLISGLLVFALGSWRLGAMSLLTNLAPAGLAYGVWAYIDGSIDLSASIVMCMSIGIVVDDTVHFLSKLRYARERLGHSLEDAIRYAFNTVGVALIVTTTVLVAGFLVLALSPFNPSATSGLLLAMTLAFALVVDLVYLPPLLLVLQKKLQVAD